MAAPLAPVDVVFCLYKSFTFHDSHDTSFILCGRERTNYRTEPVSSAETNIPIRSDQTKFYKKVQV